MCLLPHLLDLVSWECAETCSRECLRELGCVLAAQRGVVSRMCAGHTCAAHQLSAACTPTGQSSAWLDMPDFQRGSHEGYALASAGCPRRQPPVPAAQQVT